MEFVIKVRDLEKTYKSYRRGKGFLQALKSLFKRETVYSQALKGINFSIRKGEMVGFVGPNGAGKSTTIKILSGVLYPSAGSVDVIGFVPWLQRTKYVANIGAVFGQKSQLWWDLPPIDSFYLSKGIYKIPDSEFEERLETMSTILRIKEVMHRPTRDLSLGERMKCEFIMALLHNPQILFLDEPTIGVDALAKEEIREFLLQINRKYRTTVILTTHDMEDIEELCKRIIIIDDGRIIFDGSLDEIKDKYLTCKTVDFQFTSVKDKRKLASLLKKGTLLEDKKWFKSVRFEKEQVDVPKVVDELMKCCNIIDFTVHESRLEHVIKEIYKQRQK